MVANMIQGVRDLATDTVPRAVNDRKNRLRLQIEAVAKPMLTVLEDHFPSVISRVIHRYTLVTLDFSEVRLLREGEQFSVAVHEDCMRAIDEVLSEYRETTQELH